ncbi:hypothetical protein KC19_1G265900 [Ceratodon purpureus]|uniref:CSC1-like protein n=1 Tax=Ceratodon purpureus TaxID=3225 RepID=A0A8T0JD19_CERPU|nr:hypothetical protein KC19_1G265900 [Ceratodon purpureus]
MVTTSSFVISLVFSSSCLVVLFGVYVFTSRRPGNAVIYHPLRVLRGEDPGIILKGRGPFSWAFDAWKATESDLVDAAGLDATVYLHLFHAALQIIVLSAAYCIPVLVALSASNSYNTKQEKTDVRVTRFSGFDNLSMGNVEPGSPKIWGFLIGMFWVSFVTYFILLRSYRRIIDLRVRRLRRSAKARPEEFTVLVKDIPKPPANQTQAEHVDSFFRMVHPVSYARCIIVKDLRKLENLFKEREKVLRELEHAEAVFEQSKKKESGDGVRPMHKTGFKGCWGPKVDTIDFLENRSSHLTTQFEEERKRVQLTEKSNTAFVIFNNRRSAAQASQVVHGHQQPYWTVVPAPEPNECVWRNLHVSEWEHWFRKLLIHIPTFLIIVAYGIPILLVAGLLSLHNLEDILPFIKAITRNKAIHDILQSDDSEDSAPSSLVNGDLSQAKSGTSTGRQGLLPQIVLLIFLALPPTLMFALSRAEGFASRSRIVRSASAKYFYIIIFNVYFGVTIFGTIFSNLSSIKGMVEEDKFLIARLIRLLGSQLPPVAMYYITYIALKACIGYGVELSRLISLISYHWNRKFKVQTEWEKRESWAPGAFTYHQSIPNDLLILTLALCYAVIAPMILVFTFLYFLLGWTVQRNQALNVHVPDWESNGSLWPHIHHRILAALLAAQITAIAYFAVKEFVWTPILLLLPFLTLLFHVYCNRKFRPLIEHVSLHMATEEYPVQPTTSAIVEAYTPIYLRADSPGIDRRDSSERIPSDRIFKLDPSPSAASAV